MKTTSQSFLRRDNLLVVAAVLIVAVTATDSPAQSYSYPVYNWGRYYNPSDLVSQRIRAQAEMVRAVGEASVDHARAREIRAKAVRQEIINSVEYIKAYWERKSIGEAERFKRAYHHLDSKRLRNSKTWDRMKNHPDVIGNSIAEGTALNFLLDRLSGSVLAYEFSLAGSQQDPKVLEQLMLSPGTLHNLQLRQDRANGQRLVFRPDEGEALRVDWWPFILRDDKFAEYRDKFEDARQVAVKEARANPGSSLSNETVRGLLQAHYELDTAFHKEHLSSSSRVGEQYGSKMKTWQHFHTAKRFMQSLAGEISRLATTGDTSAFDGSLKFEGNNLVALLTYMSSKGLDFAPAKPGEEDAYHEVFRMMRDLYVTVADEDDGIKVKEDDDK